jgi:hypothetical protein
LFEHGPVVKCLFVLVCAALFFLIPFKIAGLGYLPGDDALRHAAYAMDNRQWSEVLVLNPAISPEMDSHPGWHGMLRAAHRVLGVGKDGLVTLEFTLAFAGFMLAGLAASRAPLAWLAAAALIMVVEPGLYGRLLLGRPFVVSMTALVLLLFWWQGGGKKSTRAEVAVVFCLLTVSVVMHPTVWYLWSLPVLALWLAGRRRSAVIVAACIPCAMVAAALLLGGRWYDVFVFPIYAIVNSVGADNIVVTNLVTELNPGVTPVIGLGLMAAIMALRAWGAGVALPPANPPGTGPRTLSIPPEISRMLREPDFLLVIIGWLLGLCVCRFWDDWGRPALLVWLCRQLAFMDRLPLRAEGNRRGGLRGGPVFRCRRRHRRALHREPQNPAGPPPGRIPVNDARQRRDFIQHRHDRVLQPLFQAAP